MTGPPEVDAAEFSSVWTRRPCRVRGLGDVRPLDVFGMFARIGAEVRAGTHRRLDDVKLFTPPPAPAEHDAHLPDAAEHDFPAYAARVSRELGKDWSFVVNSAQATSPELYRHARELFVGLRETGAGLPAGISDCFIVAGSYSTGPTQVHKDTAEVFLYVVEGVKTMLLWPYEALSEWAPPDPDPLRNHVALKIDPRDVDVAPLRLVGRPGEVLYWPASYWHCAESDGRPSLSLHLAAHRYRDLTPVWAGAFARAGVGAGDSRWVSSEQELGGDGLGFGRAAAERATSAVHEWSLARHSTANFEILPDLGRREPPDWKRHELVALQSAPISWAADAADQARLIVAANGRSFRLPHRDPTVRLLTELASLRAEEVLDLRRHDLDRESRAVLDVAYLAGAVDRMGGADPAGLT
ncbi:cupin-like domain-containing protein [Nonomuraea sp. NPDC050643]|uniref:cupin-like domain-containing protein n=1 Tax=Nonomuraea sp. NPDC050643 TaxID=3155660 RepID=UPI00340402B7